MMARVWKFRFFWSGTKQSIKNSNVPVIPPDQNWLEPMENVPTIFLWVGTFANHKVHVEIQS